MERGGPPLISVDPTTGQLVATYPDGSVVPVEAALAPAMTYEGGPDAISGPPGTSAPVVSDPLWFAEPDPASATGSAGLSGGGRSGGYPRRGDSSRSSGSGDDDFAPRPAYASGAVHPAWGGTLPQLGGDGGAGGWDNRQQVNVPGGAAAGPFATRSAPTPKVPNKGGGDYGGGSSGGGANRSLIASWRSRLMGGMYPGSSGDGDDGDATGADREREERLRGPYARGLDPTQAAGLSLRPTAMLPRVYPGLGPDAPVYSRLAALPAAHLAMLRNGYDGSTESLANNLGRVYKDAGAGKLPGTGQLFRNLESGKGINQLFQGERAGRGDMESFAQPGYVYGQEPLRLGEASSTFGGLLDAALINLPPLAAAKYSGTMPGSWGSYLIDRWGSKALNRKPGKGKSVNQYVTRRIFR